jgi:hypothetical protein
MLVKIRPNGSIELIETQPHEKYFRQWRLRLPDEAFERICELLTSTSMKKGMDKSSRRAGFLARTGPIRLMN